jgi:hypothetical protein
MPQLKLISIVCNDTEDVTGADETYLLIAGRRVWGPQSMNDNDTQSLDGVPVIRFRRSIRVDLYDQDAGWFDDDDHLGSTYVYSSQMGVGEKEHVFNGDGANYRFTYEVLPD